MVTVYVSCGPLPFVVSLWQLAHLEVSSAWISFVSLPGLALAQGYSWRSDTGRMKFSGAAAARVSAPSVGRKASVRRSWQPPHTRDSPGMAWIQVVWLRII